MGKFFINLIAGIDVFIHWGISELLRLIFIIADVNIFRAPEIEKFTNKVYGLLGVIILFKIVISAIQYLINPDKLVDKKEGIGGLLQRTIISVALLALVPTIFDFAKELQVYVSKTIPGIILGADAGNTVDDIGKNLSFDVLKVFVNPKKGKEDKVKESNKIENMSDFSKNVTAGCGGALWDGTDDCIYDYNFIFSIGVGLFMVYVLLSMGIDIGIRSIKMGLLQLLAPIPISSYINSEENFKTWYKTAFKVYADLFIRLIVIYFIIYIINSLKQGISKGTADELIRITEEPLLYIYIIVALLLFAKQAPKFICDILGIKSDGEGIGDMFKPAWSRASALAAPLAGIAAGIGSARARKGWGGNWLQATGSGLKSAISGTARGLYGAVKGDKASDVFKNSRDGARAAADKRFEFAARSGNTWAARTSTRMRESFDRFTGITTGAEQISKDRAFYEAMLSLKSNEKKNALAKVNALSGFVDDFYTIQGATGGPITVNGHTYTSGVDFITELRGLEAIPAASRTAAQNARLAILNADRTAVQDETSKIKVNGNEYESYASFISELTSLQNNGNLSDTDKIKLKRMLRDKDAVEKFMIRNQSFIALTDPSKDEGNYSSIAQDVIKIARSGTPAQGAAFLEAIGGGDGNIGAKILEKLTNHLPLLASEAISLNNYIAGALEHDAQKGISDATAHERTVPKS